MASLQELQAMTGRNQGAQNRVAAQGVDPGTGLDLTSMLGQRQQQNTQDQVALANADQGRRQFALNSPTAINAGPGVNVQGMGQRMGSPQGMPGQLQQPGLDRQNNALIAALGG